jgi:hypothetical protein
VRKHAILGIFGLVAILVPGHILMAFTFEVHPGLYTSYEYSDNYHGVSQGEQSESTYLIGPSLNLRCLSPSATFDLTGRYAKSFHQRFSEDDSPDISLITSASFKAPRQVARFSYGFERTLTRESLTDPFGEVYRHSGSIGYTAEISHDTRMNVDGDIHTEKWSDDSTTEEDSVDTGGNIGITHQLNPLDTISLTARRNYLFYEISQDVVESQGGLDVRHLFSPIFNLSLGAAYNHFDRGHDPNEDRYSVTLTGQYSFNQSTTMSATGGYNWFIMENEDVQGENIARLSLDKTFQDDSFHFRIAKEYTSDYDYVVDRYGTFDTRSADLTWIRHWLQAWSSSVGFDITKRRPISGTIGEFEIDSNARVSVTWKPIEYFTGNIIYEHLQTNYESSDTVKENRYRLVVEVRY